MNSDRKIARLCSIAATGIIARLVAAGSSIVMLPLFLKNLGPLQFAVWTIVATLQGYYGMLDMGLSNAVMRFVSRSLGSSSEFKGELWISTSWKILLALSAFSIIIVVPVSFGMSAYFMKKGVEYQNLVLVFLISGSGFALTLPTRTYYGFLMAHLRTDEYNILNTVTTIARVLLLFTALSFKMGLLEFVLIVCLCQLSQGLGLYYLFKRIHGEFHPFKTRMRMRYVRVMLHYSLFSFLAQTATLIRMRSFPLIIVFVVGPEAVGIFAIAERMRFLMSMVGGEAVKNLSAVFSKKEKTSVSNARISEMSRVYLFSLKISSILAALMLAGVFILSSEFIVLWVGDNYPKAHLLAMIICCGAFFLVQQQPVAALAYGLSRHRYLAYLNTIEAVITVSACIILGRIMGITGVAIGAALSMMIVQAFGMSKIVTKILGYNYREFVVEKLTKISVRSLLPIVPLIFIFEIYHADTWLKFILKAVFFLIFYIPLATILVFKMESRNKIKLAIKKIFGVASINAS